MNNNYIHAQVRRYLTFLDAHHRKSQSTYVVWSLLFVSDLRFALVRECVSERERRGGRERESESVRNPQFVQGARLNDDGSLLRLQIKSLAPAVPSAWQDPAPLQRIKRLAVQRELLDTRQ